MPTPAARPRRADSLSKARVVDAAIAILDADSSVDAAGLTLRALMARLGTGSGAIYHHVGTMDELRAAAADEVLRGPLESVGAGVEPADALRRIAVAVFDATTEHPWMGVQLTRAPIQPAIIRLWTSIGAQLDRLELHGAVAAVAGSTLTNYMLGSIVQSRTRVAQRQTDDERSVNLTAAAQQLEDEGGAVARDISLHLREHDDRRQFQDGVELVLQGIAAGSDVTA